MMLASYSSGTIVPNKFPQAGQPPVFTDFGRILCGTVETLHSEAVLYADLTEVRSAEGHQARATVTINGPIDRAVCISCNSVRTGSRELSRKSRAAVSFRWVDSAPIQKGQQYHDRIYSGDDATNKVSILYDQVGTLADFDRPGLFPPSSGAPDCDRKI